MKRLTDLGLVVPDYSKNTIANLPATVAALFGMNGLPVPPLRRSLWAPLLEKGDVRRVVLILIDGMGSNLIQHCAQDTHWLGQEAATTGQITSVFPSTTVNALSSLWTGAGPAQHGLVGLELFFPRLGVMGQMLALSPSFIRYPDALVRAGLKPETFLAAPGFAETLAHAGIETCAVKHYSLVNSSLSRMHGRGVKENVGIVTAADQMWQVRRLLESESDHRLFISAYWAAVDTLSHRYGYDHEAVAAELRAYLHLLHTELLEKLSPEARKGTIVIVTADHGQIKTPLEKRIFIEDYPAIQRLLLMRPAGEPHTAYLYARQGKREALIDAVNRDLGHAAIALDAQSALQDGLLGPVPANTDVGQRLGDVIVTMRDGYSLLSRDEDDFLATFVGRHGGLTPDEMHVPFYTFNLS